MSDGNRVRATKVLFGELGDVRDKDAIGEDDLFCQQINVAFAEVNDIHAGSRDCSTKVEWSIIVPANTAAARPPARLPEMRPHGYAGGLRPPTSDLLGSDDEAAGHRRPQGHIL